jgi:hypothetical protein
MPTYAFTSGQNVQYNNEVHTIFRKRGTVAPQYLIRKLADGSSSDNVAEADLTLADCADVINTVWPSFVYTGDNGAASQWVLNNVIKNMYQCNMQSEWGSNDDDSQYIYKMGTTTWAKDRT